MKTKASSYKDERKKAANIIVFIVLFLVGVLMIIPLIWMLSSSFKYETEIFASPIKWIPEHLKFDNYTKALFEYPYLKWYFNSAMVTLGALVIGLSSYSLAGYALGRMNFKGNSIITVAFIATLMIPDEVRIIPQFIMFKMFGMYNTHYALVVPWLFNGFSIFLLRQFFKALPKELSESAKIDGCGEFRLFSQIVLPLCKPALITLTIIIFNWSWSMSYLQPLVYINDINKQVLSVGITTFAEKYVNNFGAQMAGYTLAMIPVIVIFLFLQKSFVEGVALTGIKG